MKYYITAFITVFIATTSINAQSLTPEVVLSSGDNFLNGTGSLSWSLGEVATEMLSNGSGSLSQGFHYSGIEITTTVAPEISLENLNVYPNPVQNQLIIETTSSEGTLSTYTLMDISGKIVGSKKINSNKEYINMKEYASGGYILKVSNSLNSNTYKILKK